MLTRIQIRAEGPTAHAVEEELRDAARRTQNALGRSVTLSDQVIEGSPSEPTDKAFRGRLSLGIGEELVKVTGVTARVEGAIGASNG